MIGQEECRFIVNELITPQCLSFMTLLFVCPDLSRSQVSASDHFFRQLIYLLEAKQLLSPFIHTTT